MRQVLPEVFRHLRPMIRVDRRLRSQSPYRIVVVGVRLCCPHVIIYQGDGNCLLRPRMYVVVTACNALPREFR